jgi:hypothetical protein
MSSLTTPAWLRVAARILAGRGLITCNEPIMERHNSTPQDCRRESSSNYSRCSISEIISRCAALADKLDKWQTLSLSLSGHIPGPTSLHKFTVEEGHLVNETLDI